jgi:hypothetical protein
VSLRDLIRRGGRLLEERRHATKGLTVRFFLPKNGRDLERPEDEIHRCRSPLITLYEPGGPDDPHVKSRLPGPEELETAPAPDADLQHGGSER